MKRIRYGGWLALKRVNDEQKGSLNMLIERNDLLFKTANMKLYFIVVLVNILLQAMLFLDHLGDGWLG